MKRRSFLFGLAALPIAPVVAAKAPVANLVAAKPMSMAQKLAADFDGDVIGLVPNDSKVFSRAYNSKLIRQDEFGETFFPTMVITYTEVVPLEESRKRRALMEQWANFAVFPEPKINLVRG